jgi:hypothetical protein
MAAIGSGTFNQALLFFDEKNSHEQGPALWAALHEVERFFRLAQPNLTFHRFYISPQVPSLGTLESAWRSVGRLITRQGSEYVPDLPSASEFIEARIPVTAVASRSSRTYDQSKLAQEVRRLLSLGPSDGHLLIVTDRLITPPEKWRYIIWDIGPEAGVISSAPVDPAYWRDVEPHRIAYLKHRVRCSAMTITGIFLGIERCENPECYMFDDVDSITVLDTMTEFGPEHEVDGLTGMGFEALASDPSVVQVPLRKEQAHWRSLR